MSLATNTLLMNFDCSVAHGYQKFNNTTDMREYGTKTYTESYKWHGYIIHYAESDNREAPGSGHLLLLCFSNSITIPTGDPHFPSFLFSSVLLTEQSLTSTQCPFSALHLSWSNVWLVLAL